MDKIFDFRVNYFWSRNGMDFVSLSYMGQTHDVPCIINGDGTRVFRFLGQIWRR